MSKNDERFVVAGTDYPRIIPNNVYSCGFCGKTYAEVEQVEEHLEDCLRNVDNHTCLTCKHATYHLVPPYPLNRNNYDTLVQQGITSNYGYFTCGKRKFSKKLKEEIILERDKKCYEPLNAGELFDVVRDEEYGDYQDLLDDIDKGQEELDKDIREFWQMAAELEKKGLSNDEIVEKLGEFYDG